MQALALSFSLFWRLLVVWFGAALAVLLVDLLLLKLGVNFLSDEWAKTAVFIKLKPSVAYGAAALVTLVAELGVHVNPLQVVLGTRLKLSRATWHRVALGLVLLFLCLAAFNAIVAAVASTEVWVNYKLFGAIAILLLGLLGIARQAVHRGAA